MAQALVEEYRFGRIVIGGKAYERDLIVTPSGVLSPWWRKEGHLLTLEDLGEAAEAQVDSVVIGTGYSGMMEVLDDVVERFRKKGVKVYIADTRKAVEIYNQLVQKGAKVLAAFHLTC